MKRIWNKGWFNSTDWWGDTVVMTDSPGPDFYMLKNNCYLSAMVRFASYIVCPKGDAKSKAAQRAYGVCIWEYGIEVRGLRVVSWASPVACRKFGGPIDVYPFFGGVNIPLVKDNFKAAIAGGGCGLREK